MHKRKYDEYGSGGSNQQPKHVKGKAHQNHGSSSNSVPIGPNGRQHHHMESSANLNTEKVAKLLEALDDALEESNLSELLNEVGQETVNQCNNLRTILKKANPSLVSEGKLAAVNATPSSEPRDKRAPNTPKAPLPLSLTPWSAAEIPQTIPPLPQVLDPTLEESVFIHRALALKAHNLSYERLEWIGDAYIQLMSSLIIAQTFPEFMPGECSYIRQLLVKNSTLADYAHKYGFPAKVRLPTELQNGSEKDLTKIWGDVFEAYVAAVILSDPENGVSRCAAWLKPLWSMTIAKEIRLAEANGPRLVTPMWTLLGGSEPVDQNTLPKAQLNPKERLANMIGSRGVKISYRDAAPEKKDPKTKLPLFTVGCYLDGWGETDKQLGFGRGHGKKDAGFKAAEQALANKKLMNLYVEKKKLFDAQLKLEQEAEEQQNVA
ncbi:hypothetical protein BP5796_01084 [Coleophoma crateriformis]|uniref:RNase III domain-containing protein n=1 Tax=Coleophoma crateriformis TaxID=565419 RepID=A0A3D8TAD7_9HELO|nr:hypothetical protein BP5796_01084 [Coleophoma crateriformis]